MFQDSPRLPDSQSSQSLSRSRFNVRYLFWGLAIAVIGVVAGGVFSFRWFSEKLLLDLQDNLLGVAKLQATQIDQWLLERKGDARVLASRPTTIDALKAFATNDPNSAIVQQQQANLNQLALDVQTSYDYRRIVFFNRQGQVAWQTGVQNPLPKEISTVFGHDDHLTSLGGDVRLIDLNLLNVGGQEIPVYGVLAYIYDKQNDFIGAVYLEKDPQNFLYSLLDRVSSTSATAEILLVRREGNDIRYLNPLRFADNSPLQFRRSLDRESLLATQAILQSRRLVRGTDYRDIPVVGASFETTQAPWIVIYKVNLREANAPIRQLTIAISGLSGLLIGVVFWVGYQMLRLQRFKLEAIAREADIEKAQIRAASASQYLTAIETAIDGYAVLDNQGYFLEVNAALGKMTGYNPDELLQRSIFDLLITDDLDTTQLLAEWGDRRKLKLYQQWRHQTGQILEMQLSLTTDPSGDQNRFFIFVQDITQQKQANAALAESEQRLYHAIQDAPFPILLYASDGEILQLNRTWTALTGYDITEIPTIEAWATKAYGDKYLTALQGIQKVYEIQNSTHDGEYAILIKGGEKRIWDFSSAPLGTLPDGRNLEITIAMDVTERKTNELALQAAKKQAEEANRAKSLFLAKMSHELRTPLNGILGYAQILMFDESLSVEQKSSLGVIEECGHYLLSLIADVLDFSKIEAQRLELVPTAVQFHYFILDILQTCQIKATEKQLLLNYDIDPNLPDYLLVDDQRLRQVLLNLLGNAIKFTHQGSVVLEVNLSQPQEASPHSSKQHWHRVHFAVRDTGCGIEPEHLNKIFLPFEQVGDRHSRPQGTGLGLAISQKLVAMMGGELQLTSKPNKGSCFFFDLELSEVLVSPPLVSDDGATRDRRQIIGYVGRRQTILIVDHHWVNRSLIKHFLMPLGFKILEAENGKDGLIMAEAHPVDLIISEMLLPCMDAQEMAQQIRQLEKFRALPILVMSGDVLNNGWHNINPDFDAFLEKPLDFSILLDMLQTHLHFTWVYEGDR
ncbi:hypothetical protein AWQ21_07010 [Picosynechococcus sp. PCC 7003]|uniref:PAS domain S-box protein n=1 Tax=Picosynechococcus sp. PCC 7003 TaxID=374981 RepID=UPI0008108379|nr:PAS domain S-box protein [Picosynechococcus sp. PCC 7003]ANV84150.1 hypothetical protein AWQ21_07010 [Picosynechococcus sp. PCC 7003]